MVRHFQHFFLLLVLLIFETTFPVKMPNVHESNREVCDAGIKIIHSGALHQDNSRASIDFDYLTSATDCCHLQWVAPIALLNKIV